MKKLSTLIFAILASILIAPESADAATSNFQGNCAQAGSDRFLALVNAVVHESMPTVVPKRRGLTHGEI